MDHADFTGRQQNVFRDNAILSTVPNMLHSSKELKMTGNTWWYTGMGTPNWNYGDEVLSVSSGSSDNIAEFKIERLLPTPPQSDMATNLLLALQRRNRWLLAMFVDPGSAEDR